AASCVALARLRALQDVPLLDRLAREIRDLPREGARAQDLGVCLYYAGMRFLHWGDRLEADRLWGELEQLAARTHDTSLVVLAMDPAAHRALVEGRLEESLSLYNAAADRARELGVATWDYATWPRFL